MAMEGKIWLWRGIYGLLVGENGILGCLMQCRIIHVARVANAKGPRVSERPQGVEKMSSGP